MSLILNYNEAKKVFSHAKSNCYALPAINVTSTSTINATLESAKTANSPVVIQFSNSGAGFFIGDSPEYSKTHEASIRGAVAAAKYIHEVSDLYGVPILLNTDHAARNLLPWVDGMINLGEEYYRQHGRPLFTSHMIDLSQEPLQENIEISKRYLERLTKLNMYLEIELGVTGGEEDGMDNRNVDASRLYTHPEEVARAYEELMKVSDHFVIAAAFGNVHGVYKPGDVKLKPAILKDSQILIKEKFKTPENPVSFVFHGGSGSEPADVRETLGYGVVKMNIDTDIQWAYWQGVRDYYKKNEAFLQTQLGNPSDPEAANKKYYESRSWIRCGELYMKKRLLEAFEELNALNRIV